MGDRQPFTDEEMVDERRNEGISSADRMELGAGIESIGGPLEKPLWRGYLAAGGAAGDGDKTQRVLLCEPGERLAPIPSAARARRAHLR